MSTTFEIGNEQTVIPPSAAQYTEQPQADTPDTTSHLFDYMALVGHIQRNFGVSDVHARNLAREVMQREVPMQIARAVTSAAVLAHMEIGPSEVQHG